MSAAEIIEQIKALPPEERRRVEEFLSSRQAAERPEISPTPADFDAIANRVFERNDGLFRELAK